MIIKNWLDMVLFLNMFKELDVNQLSAAMSKYRMRLWRFFTYISYIKIMVGNLTQKGLKNKSFILMTEVLFMLKRDNDGIINKGLLKKLYYDTALNIFNAVIKKIQPGIILRNIRKGTVVFELPKILNETKSIKKVISKFIAVSKRQKKSMLINIYTEINNILANQGVMVENKEHIIKTAINNKPFYYLLRKKKRK